MISRFLPWFSSVEGLIVQTDQHCLLFPKVHVATWMPLVASWPSLNSLWGPIVLFLSLAQKMEATERLGSSHYNSSFSFLVVRINTKFEELVTKKKQRDGPQVFVLCFLVWNHRILCWRISVHLEPPKTPRWADPRWRSSLYGAIIAGKNAQVEKPRAENRSLSCRWGNPPKKSKRRFVVIFSSYCLGTSTGTQKRWRLFKFNERSIHTPHIGIFVGYQRCQVYTGDLQAVVGRKMCIARHDLSHKDDDLLGMCFCRFFEWQPKSGELYAPFVEISTSFWPCHCLSRSSSETLPLSKWWRGWPVWYAKSAKKNDSDPWQDLEFEHDTIDVWHIA